VSPKKKDKIEKIKSLQVNEFFQIDGFSARIISDLPGFIPSGGRQPSCPLPPMPMSEVTVCSKATIHN